MATPSVTMRRSLIEGALSTLTDPEARKAMAMQTAAIALNGGKGSVRPGVEPSDDEVTSMIASLRGALSEAGYTERLHPRDRKGEFRKAADAHTDWWSSRQLNREPTVHDIDALPPGEGFETPDGILVERAKSVPNLAIDAVPGKRINVYGPRSARRKWDADYISGDQALQGLASARTMTKRWMQEALVPEVNPSVVRSQTMTATTAKRPAKPKAMDRGRKTPKAEPKAEPKANGDFEQLHPRGRGGVWIKKGQGTTSPSGDPQVAQAQKRLHQLGYGPGAPDGRNGPLTQAAIEKLQGDYGLAVTGEIDPATYQTMLNPPPRKLADQQQFNRQEAALPNAQGDVPGAASGTAAGTTATAAAASPGAATLDTKDPEAVKTFQRAHGLTVDGIVGPNTEAMMRGSSVSPAEGRVTNPDGTTATKQSDASQLGTETSPAPTTTTTKPAAAKAAPKTGKGKDVIGEGSNATPEAVKTIQTALADLGYDLGTAGVDGKFGAYTDRAVRKLQREHGLKADGKVGRRTLRLMKKLRTRQSNVASAKGRVRSGDEIAEAERMRSLQDGLLDASQRLLLAVQEGDGSEQLHWRAAVDVYTRKLEEAVPDDMEIDESLLSKLPTFNEKLHPRGRGGRFRDALDVAKGNKTSDDPLMGRVVRASSPSYMAGRAPAESIGLVTGSHFEGGGAMNPSRLKKYDVTSVRPPGVFGKAHTQTEGYDMKDLTLVGKGKRRNVSEGLADRFAEATAERLLAQESGDQEAFVSARAAEQSLARRIVSEAVATDVDLVEARAIVSSDDASPSLRRAAAAALDEADGCAMPHAAMSKKGMLKCPKCGAGIGKKAKTIQEAMLTAWDEAMDPIVCTERALDALTEAQLSEAEIVGRAEWAVLSLLEAADSMAKASTPEPFSTSKTSNWVARAGGLPAYIQHIAHDIHEKRGKSVSQAIQIAIGVVKRWAKGVGNVDATTRAAAAKAVAEWEKLKAKAHASKD